MLSTQSAAYNFSLDTKPVHFPNTPKVKYSAKVVTIIETETETAVSPLRLSF